MYRSAVLQSEYGVIDALMWILWNLLKWVKKTIQDRMALHSARRGVTGFPLAMSAADASSDSSVDNVHANAPSGDFQLPSLAAYMGCGVSDARVVFSVLWLFIFTFFKICCVQMHCCAMYSRHVGSVFICNDLVTSEAQMCVTP